MQYEKLQLIIFKKLESELSPNLCYHSVRHTCDVTEVCVAMADTHQLNQEDKILLLSAAVLHDSGFLNTIQNHEAEGVEIAKALLPDLAYSQLQIEQIANMIMATKVPQSPKTVLERILCDADLDYLGRDDFYTIGNTLFEELKSLAVISTHQEWDALQIKFLSAHSYHTSWSITNREPKKKKYLAELSAKWI